jgi:hypothetical protein
MIMTRNAFRIAMITLTLRESHAVGSFKNSWYHLRVTPTGGHPERSPGLKDIINRTKIGRKMNA